METRRAEYKKPVISILDAESESKIDMRFTAQNDPIEMELICT